MESIANYIIENYSYDINETISYSVMQCGAEMDMQIDDICDELFYTLIMENVSDFEVFKENEGCQRATIISFKYGGRKCDIGEHFGTQRDYFWVRLYPVV